jgi:putative transposase
MYKSEKQSSTLKNLGHFFHNELTKDENFIWLQEQNTKVLKQAIRDLLSAYSMFFKKINGFPTYKTKKSNQYSCRFPLEAISKINDYSTRKLSLANIHDIKFRCSKNYLDYIIVNKNNIRSATLSKNCAGHYFLSILIDGSLRKELPYADNRIGIDLGVKDFVVTSDGEVFDNPHIKKSRCKRIKRLHRRISKKQKGSKNRNKARIKLAKEYEKIDNIKKNYLHLVSNSLLNDNQVIVMEDLNVKGMMKNHNLAESIQEMNFGEFRRMLSYKAAWYGRQLELVSRWYPSSKTCSCCGHIYKELTLSEREWTCPVCGEHLDRDLNAARNILDEGIRIIGSRTPEFKSVETSPLLSEQSRKQAEPMKQKVYE